MISNKPANRRFRPVIHGRRKLYLLAAACAGLVMLTAAAPGVMAGGNETVRGAYEMSLTVDSRWAGGANGGYYPVRIRLTNTARPRVLKFQFIDLDRGDSKLPMVERHVQIDQNATLQFTLSIPLVAEGTGGELRVYENGRLLDQFSQHVSVPGDDTGSLDRPSLLVIHPSPSSINCDPFETAVQSLAAGAAPATGGRTGLAWSLGAGAPTARANDFQTLAPALLPESWIDYTALDIVAIPLATFEKLPTAARSAIVKWVEAGGTLLVTETGEPGGDSKTLAQLLDLGSRSFRPGDWSDAQPSLVKPLPAKPPEPGAAVGGKFATPTTPATTDEEKKAEEVRTLELANTALWPHAPLTFSSLPLLAGRVYAFPANPFPGAAIDWAWWLNSAQWSNRLVWTARLGNSSRERHPEFFEFLVPGVGSVPVLPFVILITVFAIVIGPVNYFVVLRRKQLYLLVVTIPAIAFITSCALFGFALIADGFRVQSRLRSVTLLDQGTKRAVSFNRIAFFAGLAPSAGLRFSPETAVLPVWRDDLGLESGTVDWTETQALTNGWLRSRTRTQFETLAHRDERGRVEFSSPLADTPPDAANGLAFEIDTLVVRDEQGRLFSGRNIPSGGTLKLHPLDAGDLASLKDAVTQDPLGAPPGPENISSSFRNRRRHGWMYYGNDSGPKIGFSRSILETHLQRVSRADSPPSEGGLAPRTYFATFRENPGIELGVERTIPRGGVHVLLGSY